MVDVTDIHVYNIKWAYFFNNSFCYSHKLNFHIYIYDFPQKLIIKHKNLLDPLFIKYWKPHETKCLDEFT